ncbi:C4-dicarboxylate ABC transporter [Terribacillus saccharophilus]|uniref:TRAP transporter permease n=1 Tax=Terribacillus saccharophilus TaxID=361277 RepID=UPI000BA63D9E|nr:TRAP transporter permease [Terribacillus saccharophilus]PAF20459.1 C4-dicarboxylate ABC transporter [Terribacillus saccharophilus]PAF35353.1 C4-dicarboxylate ABC transporter [Terribacillus saccharophilus]
MNEKAMKLDILSEQEQQQLIEKYDSESNFRKLAGIMGAIVFFLLLAFSLYQLYTATFGNVPTQIHRSIHLGFGLVLIYLLFPVNRKSKEKRIAWYDYLLAALGFYIGAYWPVMYDNIIAQGGQMTTMDFITGSIAVLLVLEATRRTVGLPIVIIAILFMAYAYWGRQLPDFIVHPGVDLDTLVYSLFFTTEGMLGTPIGVSATYIFLFLLFGAFLVKTGVGQYFNDLALLVAGRRIGGPAKVAIFSSALQGTVSGSSVANVVTSGSFTIPMMKRLGYSKNFAGAVEASSSTGGQIMPPVMGAAAFLMVEFIGVSYWTIAKAAIIPAILYFAGIWIMTHFEAKRTGLRGLKKEELPNKKEVLSKLYLLLPIIAMVFYLSSGLSIMRAALYGIVTCVLVALIRKEVYRHLYPIVFGVVLVAYLIYSGVTGSMSIQNGLIIAAIATVIVSYFFDRNFLETIEALVDGARTALAVIAATAAAGIIVAVVTKTGLGLSLANSLVGLANEQLFWTLFFTMIASLILGMGAPTTANYIITSTIAAPAIILLGISDLQAHMFVFYFGIMADITPPVALAAFAAAGMSGGRPIATGVISTKLAIAAFIIPYMFVFAPELLLVGTSNYLQVAWIFVTAFLGMIAIGAGMIGYWFRRLYWPERLVALAAGLALIYPGVWFSIAGIIVFAALIAFQYMYKRSEMNQPVTS